MRKSEPAGVNMGTSRALGAKRHKEDEGNEVMEILSQPTNAEKGSADFQEVKDNRDYTQKPIKAEQKPQGSLSIRRSKNKCNQLSEEG